MIDIAEEVIVVADSTKFKKTGLAFIQNFEKIDKLITDDGIDEADLLMLKKNNVEVLIARTSE